MDGNAKALKIETIISSILRVGVFTSALIILVGLVMFLATGHSGYSGSYYPTTPMEIFTGVIAFKSYAIMMLGLLLLMLTPVFQIGASILVFSKEKDYLYVKITSLVFLILLISFILGKVE